MPARSASRRTKPAEERREDLIAAAAHLFQINGIEPTTVEQITAEAGVAKGTFYLYFSSKDDVVNALRDQFVHIVLGGINSGLNAGINVMYSGTVAAAIEGSFFGITSIAVSLEWDDHADYAQAAAIARRVIEQILATKGDAPQLYNLNIPTAAVNNPQRALHVVPMGLARWGDKYEKRIDPRGRPYFWATGDRPPSLPNEGETDVLALKKGHLTLTPLHFDLTQRGVLEQMRAWRFQLDG